MGLTVPHKEDDLLGDVLPLESTLDERNKLPAAKVNDALRDVTP